MLGLRGSLPPEPNGTVDMINAERALDALGDPTRRLVFKRLRNGTRSVTEVAEGMEVSRPAVSQHLKVLKAAGLVVARADGIEALHRWLDSFWDDALAAFADAAGREASKGRKPR
jgi:DNA-binding transcriptional ArsR family regulator